MKVEWRTILGASFFLGATGGRVLGPQERARPSTSGVAMLIFGFAAYGMLFGYLLLQYMTPAPDPPARGPLRRHLRGRRRGRSATSPPRPSGRRAWGSGLIFGAVGLIFGLWYLIIGGILFFGAVIGWVVESEYEVDVPDTEEEEEAAAAAGHPGHLDPMDPHLEHLD